MGRSVGTLNDAVATVFGHLDPEQDGGFADTYLLEDLRSRLQHAYPSLTEPDERNRWVDREGLVLLHNSQVQVVAYQYGWLWSINLGTVTAEHPDLAQRNAERMAPRFTEIVTQVLRDQGATPLRRMGTFSTGESAFEEAS